MTEYDKAVLLGFVAGALWALGVILILTWVRSKPRSMKQVAGDNSTQIQVNGDLKK